MMWRVTVLADNGGQVPVTVDADSMGEAVDAVIERPGVANVIECERLEEQESSRPRFSVGDAVSFKTSRHELAGTVGVVDYRGRESACFKGCDWSYDIWVDESPESGKPCLYKHIPECDVEARYA